MWPAERQASAGFVNHVVARGHVLERALELAQKIAANSRLPWPLPRI